MLHIWRQHINHTRITFFNFRTHSTHTVHEREKANALGKCHKENTQTQMSWGISISHITLLLNCDSAPQEERMISSTEMVPFLSRWTIWPRKEKRQVGMLLSKNMEVGMTGMLFKVTKTKYSICSRFVYVRIRLRYNVRSKDAYLV